MAKEVFIKLMKKKKPGVYIHVPVCKGQYVTDKHGFVKPMRRHNGFDSLHVDILAEQFEAPRVLP